MVRPFEVISPAQFGITQRLVGAIDLFDPLLAVFVASIDVGMRLFDERPIDRPNFRAIGASGQSQYGVQIEHTNPRYAKSEVRKTSKNTQIDWIA
jgi:hypothetical protein